jgi:hypothetical protein
MIQLEVHKEKATAELRKYYMNSLPDCYKGTDFHAHEIEEKESNKISFRESQRNLRGLRAIEAAPSWHSRLIQFLVRNWGEVWTSLNLSLYASSSVVPCEQSMSR